MGVINATLKLVMVMVVVVVMMMMTTMMMTTTMTMMGIIMMMTMMMLIKKEVCVLKFNKPMSMYLNSYLAPEGLGNETKEIVLRLSNG